MKTDIAYCPHCNQEAGYWDDIEERWHGEVVHKACQNKAKFEKLSILDKSSKTQTFENAKSLSDIETDYMQGFKRYCNNFDLARREGVGLLLYGNAGTGKTFYMSCVVNDLTNRGYKVLSFSISGYLNEIKKGYDKNSEINNVEEKLLNTIDEVDLIAIDDAGSEKISKEWGEERMFNLFDRIYRQNKALIMTSNLSGEGLKSHFLFNGSDKIFDRLLQMCKGYKFSWGSRRKIIGNEKFAKVFGEAI